MINDRTRHLDQAARAVVCCKGEKEKERENTKQYIRLIWFYHNLQIRIKHDGTVNEL